LKKKTERAIARVVLATGVSSVVTQLLTIREFLTQFQGNEIVIALILFAWLVIGGCGTLLARFALRSSRFATVAWLGGLSLFLTAVPALQILAIRLLRDVFFLHGASVGFYPTLAFIFLSLIPYCLVLGFVLPLSLFVIRRDRSDYPGTRIYILDNLGDVSGGALFAFVLVFLLNPLAAILVAHLPLLLSAILLFPSHRRRRPVLLSAAVLVSAILVGSAYYERESLEPRTGHLVDYRETRYGRLTVHADRNQRTLFEDGRPVFSSENRTTAEEAVHYALAQRRRPQRVLLLSIEGGMLKEVRKHRPQAIDYVEINPAVTDVLFRHGMIEPVPELRVIHRDGRAFLADTETLYDAVLVSLPEPDTFQINRFFTAEFFRLVRRRLAPGGLLSFSVQGYENYLAEPQRQKISSLKNSLADEFAHILILPGRRIYFVCSDEPLSRDIPARLAAKGIATAYIDGFYYGNVTDFRIRQLADLLDPAAPANTDTAPYLMQIMFRQWFKKFDASPRLFNFILIAAVLIYLLRISREEFVLFSTGCTTMGSEILVIFAFQIYFGYIYFQIGVIVTVFLAGLLPGAMFGHRLRTKHRRLLLISDGALMLLLGFFILALDRAGEHLPAIFYLAFGFGISVVCGFQFPIALALQGDDNRAATRFFSADLIGAAAGTLLTSVLLIPYMGILWTAAAFIGLKFISLLVVGSVRAKYNAQTFSLV
jgi:spermidine synthase